MSRLPQERLENPVVGRRARVGGMGFGETVSPTVLVTEAVEEMDDFFVVADTGGRVLYGNPSYRAWLGKEDVKGQALSASALLPEETNQREGAWGAVWEHRNWTGSYWIQAPGGGSTRRYLVTSLTALDGCDGENRGFVVVARDETESYAASEVTRRIGEDNEFRRVVSFLHHEVANPLTTIVAANSLLSMEEGVSGEQRRCLDELASGVAQLRETLKLLRDSVKPSNASRRPVSVMRVFQQAEVLVHGLAEESQVEVLFKDPTRIAEDNLEESAVSQVCEGSTGDTAQPTESSRQNGPIALDSGVMVLGDPEALTEVLQHLVENAIEQAVLCQKGLVTVTAVEERQSVLIEVADSAGGVDAKQLTELFSAFYTTKSSGRGLGLTTARRLVTHMSGLIEAHNNEVGGLSVTVRLARVG